MRGLIFFLLFSGFSISGYTQAPVPGAIMPKATFYKADGNKFTTDQIAHDKKSLLMFFDATCGHCQKVATAISKRKGELGNIHLYLISQDEMRSIDYFLHNYGKSLLSMKNVTILQDKDQVFIPLFFPQQFPSLYLFGTDKKLIYYSSNDKDVPKFFKLINP